MVDDLLNKDNMIIYGKGMLCLISCDFYGW